MGSNPRFTSYPKLVLEAERSKQKVKTAQIGAYQKWQKKLGAKAARLDKIDKDLRDLQTIVEDAAQRAEEDDKTRKRILRLLEGAYKELETFREIPVKESLPPPPKNIVALSTVSGAIVLMLVYLAAVKAYMAMAEALSKSGKK